MQSPALKSFQPVHRESIEISASQELNNSITYADTSSTRVYMLRQVFVIKLRWTGVNFVRVSVARRITNRLRSVCADVAKSALQCLKQPKRN